MGAASPPAGSTARQKGEAIFAMVASFHEQETGFDHAAAMPPAPAPEACPDPRQGVERLDGPARYRMKGMLDTMWPIEFRPTDLARYSRRRGARTAPDPVDADRRTPPGRPGDSSRRASLSVGHVASGAGARRARRDDLRQQGPDREPRSCAVAPPARARRRMAALRAGQPERGRRDRTGARPHL